jgi:hypothetical protein
MSRDVDPSKPKDNADLMYLAERNQLTAEWVEKLGGAEGVHQLLSGEKVVKIKKAGSAEDAELEEDEEETEDDETKSTASTRSTAAKR